jgi:hypothetical protein
MNSSRVRREEKQNSRQGRKKARNGWMMTLLGGGLLVSLNWKVGSAL